MISDHRSCSRQHKLTRILAENEMTTEKDLYEWLGADSQGIPYHLHPLNLVWSKEGVEHDLQVYRSVTERLRGEPDFWSTILRGAYGWRPTLVGCACLLLGKESGFFDELTECFENGSFVQPQVAVTLGLLHAERARRFCEAFLSFPEFLRAARAVVSAQRVLQRLGALSELEVQLGNWSIDQQDDAALANAVVIKHWSFWSCRA
jgi:hypothetical protein